MATLEGRVTRLENWAASQKEDIRVMSCDISTILETLDKHTEQITNVQQTLDQHTKQITSIQQTLDQHTRQITDLQTQVSGLQTQVSDLQTQVSGLQTQFTGMETQFCSMREKQDEHTVMLGKQGEMFQALFRHLGIPVESPISPQDAQHN